MENMASLIDFRKKELYFYSPYNFIRELSIERQFEKYVLQNISSFLSNSNNQIITIHVNGNLHEFYISLLPWDTNYFGIETYKLSFVLYAHQDLETLAEAVALFLKELFLKKVYCFTEIPSEDALLIQALGVNKFRQIETRLTYFRGDLSAFNEPRYPVRKANENDIPNLMHTAREMRNDYDRFHADTVFNKQIADEFLATYIEQSIKGFSDIVLTPDDINTSSDSFLTAKYFKHEWTLNGTHISKMVLSAVSAKTNKGWYKKLISEMTYHLYEEGAEYIYMNTQSTNRAVFYTWENLGYRLGCTSHILSNNNL
jgi:dTDP-4-amino-4,6-dideoxy-D-galactose acyltransferase